MRMKRGIWFLLVFSLVIIGCQPKEQIEIVEESAGSGFLEVETFPSDAEIFVDGTYSGKSPTTLYNIPIGPSNIVIKKEGYEDFVGEVNIEAGKKAFLEGNLVLIQTLEETLEVIGVVEEELEEESEEVEEKKEETLIESVKAGNTVNIGNKILFYYDFSEEEFADIRQSDSDIFSKRFDSYLVFTRYSPAKIKTIDKGIDEIEKEDCIGIAGQFEYLHSGRSLCIITKENKIVAIGGEWEYTANTELTWKFLD
ncbi:MAG: hypothetical protein CL471_18085 [Acidobacteria bacterium]|nr:hypothetical protein [Acidobacteriota bacterium]|tara:strand:+ start:3836 stop:4597 length:762 start_codon:yes stop_codon:yes gene_type:complete